MLFGVAEVPSLVWLAGCLHRILPPPMVQILSSTAEKMKNFAVIYLVDISEVPDFSAMYELYDPCTVMFFFRNKVRGNLRRPL